MEGFTYIDAIVAGVILLSALLAYSRGLTREALAIAGWVVAAVVGFVFAPAAAPLLRQVPVLGDFLGDSCELGVIAAFAAVFALALVIVSIFTPLFASMVQRSALSGLDQGLGFMFGVARGAVIVALGFFLYTTVAVTEPVAAVDDSRSAKVFTAASSRIASNTPTRALGWLTARYERLVSVCASDGSPV